MRVKTRFNQNLPLYHIATQFLNRPVNNFFSPEINASLLSLLQQKDLFTCPVNTVFSGEFPFPLDVMRPKVLEEITTLLSPSINASLFNTSFFKDAGGLITYMVEEFMQDISFINGKLPGFEKADIPMSLISYHVTKWTGADTILGLLELGPKPFVELFGTSFFDSVTDDSSTDIGYPQLVELGEKFGWNLAQELGKEIRTSPPTDKQILSLVKKYPMLYSPVNHMDQWTPRRKDISIHAGFDVRVKFIEEVKIALASLEDPITDATTIENAEKLRNKFEECGLPFALTVGLLLGDGISYERGSKFLAKALAIQIFSPSEDTNPSMDESTDPDIQNDTNPADEGPLDISGITAIGGKTIAELRNIIFFYVVSKLTKNNADAEDITHDCIIKMCRAVQEGKYEEGNTVRARACRIARNLRVDSTRRRDNLPLDGEPFEIRANTPGFGGYEPSIEDKKMAEEFEQRLKIARSKLLDSQIEILELRVDQKLSFKEIAMKLGISINTALGRYRYAVENLRRIMHITVRNHTDATDIKTLSSPAIEVEDMVA